MMEQVMGVVNKLVEKGYIMMEQGMGVMDKLVDKQGTVEL
jgi:polyhydroxyalkanoate synthesis regulator phasin